MVTPRPTARALAPFLERVVEVEARLLQRGRKAEDDSGLGTYLVHHDLSRVVAAARGEAVDWDDVFAGYQATVDWPACVFWRELMDAYPDAKVLLSVRGGIGRITLNRPRAINALTQPMVDRVRCFRVGVARGAWLRRRGGGVEFMRAFPDCTRSRRPERDSRLPRRYDCHTR